MAAISPKVTLPQQPNVPIPKNTGVAPIVLGIIGLVATFLGGYFIIHNTVLYWTASALLAILIITCMVRGVKNEIKVNSAWDKAWLSWEKEAKAVQEAATAKAREVWFPVVKWWYEGSKVVIIYIVGIDTPKMLTLEKSSVTFRRASVMALRFPRYEYIRQTTYPNDFCYQPSSECQAGGYGTSYIILTDPTIPLEPEPVLEAGTAEQARELAESLHRLSGKAGSDQTAGDTPTLLTRLGQIASGDLSADDVQRAVSILRALAGRFDSIPALGGEIESLVVLLERTRTAEDAVAVRSAIQQLRESIQSRLSTISATLEVNEIR